MLNNSLQHSIKWEQRQRLTLLEATVFWSGAFSTQVLMAYFGISRVQASKDLTLYQSLCPGNIRYDKYSKRYVIDEAFKPGFMDGSVGEFLRVLKNQQGTSGAALVTLMQNLPEVAVVEPAFRQINPLVLQSVNQAIVSGREVKVCYQSMSRPEPVQLLLCPHTLVFDGLRWHVRAYSVTHQAFRDFVLARMSAPELLCAVEVKASEDVAWHQFVTVKIAAHPGLNDMQKQVIEFDYGMESGELVCEVRAALLPYFLKTMRIGDDDLARNAMVQQIVLLNRAELASYLVF